jgi:hypothetical protein
MASPDVESSESVAREIIPALFEGKDDRRLRAIGILTSADGLVPDPSLNARGKRVGPGLGRTHDLGMSGAVAVGCGTGHGIPFRQDEEVTALLWEEYCAYIWP